MIEIEESVVIERPVEAVFALISDPSQEPRWRPEILKAEFVDDVGEEGPQVGTKIRYLSRFLGKKIESMVQITAHEPNRLLAYETISGPIKVWGRDAFAEVEEGTRVTTNHQGKFQGLFRIAEPLVQPFAVRSIRSNLKNLKNLMEAEQ